MAQSPDTTIEAAIGHHQAGRLTQAERIYRHILAQQPDHAAALEHLGLIALQAGRAESAAELIGRAAALNPRSYKVHGNLGNALAAAGRADEAIAEYRTAIALNSELPELHYNFGSFLQLQGQLNEAIVCYLRAVALKRVFPEAQYNLAGALQDIGEVDAAIAAYRQALADRPGFVQAHSNLLLTLHYHPVPDPQAIALEHWNWGRRHAEPLSALIDPPSNDHDPKRRLRIGYVSPDFRQHAVAPMVFPLLAAHDRERFEIFCYAQVNRPDAMTDRFRAVADHWRDTIPMGDDQMAARIRSDRIDILVDLAGHTVGSRLLVFARKPAPVQVSRQGYPNTTGLTTIDYRMTDALADPPGISDTLHSERLIRLPRTNWIYQPPDDAPPPNHAAADEPIDRPITFGCFNTLMKVTDPMLAVWARILKAVPGSRLLLKAEALGKASIRERVAGILTREGIEPRRVELRGHAARPAEHLTMYNQVDIALDPYPYHGTTTTCEAMWMGVPVITLAGRTHVSRVGVSLLTNVGLPELIAQSEDQYVQIARDLAGDRPRLRQLHESLRQRLARSPVMEAHGFAREIESAYRQMWREWCFRTAPG